MHIGVLLVVLFLQGISVNTQMITKNNKSCSGITLGAEFGISVTHILKKPAKGMNLKICQSNLTCCSQQMEKGLYIRSSRLLKDALHLAMNDTLNFLATQESTFDDYFKQLFIRAQAEWHSMLFQTYKQTYKENRDVFQTFFSTLEDYYGNGNVNLTSASEAFFDVLLRKVLVLLRPSLNGSHGFLDCVSNKIDRIYYPFVSSRMDLTSQLESSLTASRRFVEGLKVARDVAAALINQRPTTNCFESFTKIRHCSICRGIQNATVCKGSCENVLQSCFPAVAAVNAQWNDYFDQLYRLSIAMEGPYNIKVVAGRLSYDISSAIMNLQNNLGVILKEAKRLCVGKTKRSADSTGSDLYLEGDGRSKRASSTLPKHFGLQTSRLSRNSVISFDSLTTNFRKQINGKKNEWSTLPNKICSDGSFVSSDNTSNCWNGIGLQSNSSNVPQLKSINNKANSLVVDVQVQLLLLKIEMEKIKLALPEQDEDGDVVRQRDDDDDDDDSSGNSSGSGSGSGTTDTTVTATVLTDFSPTFPSVQAHITEDDEEDNMASGSGSGTTPPNEIVEFSTKATKSNNSVDYISTDSDQIHPNDVSIFLPTDPDTLGSKNNSAGSSLAHLWLFLSALLLSIF